jgi:SAM-dependent methyltransferase
MIPNIPADRKNRIDRLGYDYAAQPKGLLTGCNLCGDARLVHLTHRDRYGYPARASACSQCGLAFLNPVMTREAYAEFYARTYRPLVSAFHNRIIDAQTIQAEQKEYAQRLAALLKPWLATRRSHTLLDIGGSTGVVALELARQFALQTAVLDPAAAELEWAARAGVEAIAGFLEEYDADGRQFDVTILCQTIDHLTDASGSLGKIRRLVRPGGLFFVDIVDFRAAYLRNRSVEEAVKIDHPYYFTEDTVEILLSRAGFHVLEKDYSPDHLHVGYICTPGEPQPTALPDARQVREFFREVRSIQNAPR